MAKRVPITRPGGPDGKLLERTVPAHTINHWRSLGWSVKGETPDQADETAAPAASASKAEWVEHAVAQGLDRAEAEDLTRNDLAARFGA